MALPTAALLQETYPEFKPVTVPVCDDAIKRAGVEVSSDAWGDLYATGVMTLAAHLLVTSGASNPQGAMGGGATSGPVQSVRVGEVQVSYGAGASNAIFAQGLDASLASTKYGLEFARLRRSLAFGAAVV